MLLSIVMMIKNEEKYLNRTLEKLLPLMKEIDSELIILDTGSTDNSVDIARKYTDKVYFCEWNNNFGNMRNKSISYAKGEWILVLDADEELLSYDKLKEFFASDLCEKYNSATIELKNILSEDEKRFALCSIPRLFKNYDGFKYEGAIHEQPLCKGPIYNRIVLFKHYGYLFVDEELRQQKNKRNMLILLGELKADPNNPYMNYQLGKQYIAVKSYEDAVFFIEKSYDLYAKTKNIPTCVISDLSNIYISLYKYNKCEKLCNKYIKGDNKNIDVYYYLATSQKALGKYKESIESYKRYIYLLDNYDISTQANNMSCTCETISYITQGEVNMIYNYYNLENYKEIVSKIETLSDEVISQLHLVICMSLYKENKFEKVIGIYNKCCKTIVDKNKFKGSLEEVIIKAREEDKCNMYKVLSKFEGNYGIVNSIRLGERLTAEEYSKILTEESDSYYGDILYYWLEDKEDITELLMNVSHIHMQNYLSYLIVNRSECILKLYEFLLNAPITLDMNRLNIYSCLSKTLLFAGSLMNEKYENLFLMYITYQYEYIRKLYNENLSDEDLITLVKDTETMFIIEFISVQRIKQKDGLKYIKSMKRLLIENPQYKKGIEIFIKKFQGEFDENKELTELKRKYKSIIENSINHGNLQDAKNMIDEYETISREDIEILNMKSIICLLNNEFSEAEKTLKKALILNPRNYDTLFNIGYLKETLDDIEEAIRFYDKIVFNCEDEDLVNDASEKVKLLKENTDCVQGA